MSELPYPKHDEPATRSELFRIASARLEAVRANRRKQEEEYPGKLEQWRSTIRSIIKAATDEMIEYLEEHPYGPEYAVPVGFLTHVYDENNRPKMSLPGAPQKPDKSDTYFERREVAIIEFLGLISHENLTSTERDILRNLGASYD